MIFCFLLKTAKKCRTNQRVKRRISAFDPIYHKKVELLRSKEEVQDKLPEGGKVAVGRTEVYHPKELALEKDRVRERAFD